MYRFDRDLKWRTGVEIVPIHCSSSNGFKITEAALLEAYQNAQNLNLNVKGVLITNPSNPLGTTMSTQELNLLLQFIATKNLHLISDEIYSGTVFRTPEFVSIMEILNQNYNPNHKIHKQVHIVYSVSKDLGLPGFRVGAIYSNDEAVVSAATKMSSFGLVSSQTQYLLSAMLSDKEFRRNYIKENKKRLEKRQRVMVRGLEKAGIKCHKGNAGLFCWVDMRHLLRENSFESEMEVWKKMVFEVRLNVSPGQSCHCSEPGWFRVCFANMSLSTLDLAMQRIKGFVSSDDTTMAAKQLGYTKRKSSQMAKWVFRLSVHDRSTTQLRER